MSTINIGLTKQKIIINMRKTISVMKTVITNINDYGKTINTKVMAKILIMTKTKRKQDTIFNNYCINNDNDRVTSNKY